MTNPSDVWAKPYMLQWGSRFLDTVSGFTCFSLSCFASKKRLIMSNCSTHSNIPNSHHLLLNMDGRVCPLGLQIHIHIHLSLTLYVNTALRWAVIARKCLFRVGLWTPNSHSHPPLLDPLCQHSFVVLIPSVQSDCPLCAPVSVCVALVSLTLQEPGSSDETLFMTASLVQW